MAGPELVADATGRQERDFLLVTSIPNIYSRNGIVCNRLVIVGGVHGIGTRAIDLVLQSPQMLEHLMTETKDMEGWQALIPVTHLSLADGIPLKLGDAKVYPIKANWGRLHDHYRGKRFLM